MSNNGAYYGGQAVAGTLVSGLSGLAGKVAEEVMNAGNGKIAVLAAAAGAVCVTFRYARLTAKKRGYPQKPCMVSAFLGAAVATLAVAYFVTASPEPARPQHEDAGKVALVTGVVLS